MVIDTFTLPTAQKIEQISKYDPSDLVSGAIDGILKAIRALGETPQNHLCKCKNGEDFFGASSVNKLSTVRFDHIFWKDEYDIFKKLMADLLSECDILSKQPAIQRLDYHDVEGATQAYRLLRCLERLPQSSRQMKGFPERGGTGDSRHLLEEDSHWENGLQRSQEQTIQFASSTSLEQCQKILQHFLISASAEDCGLVRRLQPRRQNSGDIILMPAFSGLWDGDYLHKVWDTKYNWERIFDRT